MSGHHREGLRKHSCTGSHLEKDCTTILAKENMKETKKGVELKLFQFQLVNSKAAFLRGCLLGTRICCIALRGRSPLVPLI